MSMSVPRTRGLLNQFDRCSDEVRSYYEHFPKLAEEFPWDVTISYLFARVELAHNMTLYCGMVKQHKVDTGIARTAVDNRHMTRDGFKELFKAIMGKSLKHSIIAKMKEAEKIRDKILHGKSVKDEDKRKAIADIIAYADLYNSFVFDIGGFKPFGPLQGFKGRGAPLDKSTSRWIVKGMGFELS